MAKYSVRVIKVLAKEIVVEADSVKEASDMACELAYDELWDEVHEHDRTDVESVQKLSHDAR